MSFLSGRSELKTAALIAHKFKLDPVDVLNATRFQWAIRIAALNYIGKLEKEEADKAKSSARKK